MTKGNELKDLFADEYTCELPPAAVDQAVAEWNRRQPAWKPVKTWAQLTLSEKLETCTISVGIVEARKSRDEQIMALAERVSFALKMTVYRQEAEKRLCGAVRG